MSWRGCLAVPAPRFRRVAVRVVCAALAALLVAGPVAGQSAVPRTDGPDSSGPVLQWVSVRPGDTSVVVELGMARSGAVRYRTVRPDDGSYVEVVLEGARVAESVGTEISVHRADLVRVMVREDPGPPPAAVVRLVLSARASVDVTRRPDGMGLVVRVSGGRAPGQATAPPGPVSVFARATPVTDVLAMVARSCGFQLVASQEVSGQVTLSVSGLTCEVALEVLSAVSGVRFRRFGDVVVAFPAGKVQEESYPELYQVRSARPDEAAKEIQQLVKGVSVVPLERDGSVIVIATQDQHREVRRVLQMVDVAGVQVSIETAVVDVSMNRLRELGFSWGVGTPGQGSGAIQITVGEATVFARLAAMVSDGSARVMASPRVTTRSGEKASVSLGEEVPIPQRDPNGNITFSFRRIGVGLDITPRVGRDGVVSVELGLRVDQVLEFLSTPSGPVPRIGTREVRSSVRVESGRVLVVGGLITRQERQSTVKVPVLGDIPVLGELFRLNIRSESESEVVFLIRPVVLGGRGDAGSGSAEADR